MDARLTSNDFLFPPGRPEQFRWTQKAREELGPRFARRGIQLDALHTREDIADAIAKVIVFEYNALTPEQRTDSALVQQIYDLEFIVYPLHGFPLRSLAERRAMQHEAMRWVLDLPAADRPPRPTEAPREGLGGIWRAAMDGALIHPGPPGGRPKFRRSPAAAACGYSDLLPSRMDRHRAAPG